MNYLSVENISKSYGEKVLFENISFGIAQGQKVALVAKNGTGKTTLLRILTEADSPDSGELSFRNGVSVGFLDQNPQFGESATVLEAIFASDNPVIQAIKDYEACLQNPEQDQAMQQALLEMDNLKAWEYEVKIKQILSKLNISELNQELGILSGGQRKRVALAKLLIDEPDFFILDEPTNHLDLDMIEWLEEFLGSQKQTLLMVTHDRYFLERVCDTILEMDGGNIYSYKGNYSHYLEKREERHQLEVEVVGKARNLMRKELDWIRRQPKARGTKAKYRIDAFQELKKEASKNVGEKELKMGLEMSRLGKKILELDNLCKSYGDLKILEDFSYVFKRRERIGIVGKNGVGKSTFLNIITGKEENFEGEVTIGETVVFGYYTQDGIKLDEDKRVIDVVLDIAEYIPLANGQNLTAAQLLERFLFSRKAQYTYVSTLSGGERRRLYLLTVLIKNPNFLILDEPTNDLDILTLNVLEDFLEEFGGCLMIVTHDRYFMDKLVDHLFVFEGEGTIRDFNGSYSEYRAVRELEQEEEKKLREVEKKKEQATKEKPQKSKPEKKKLSYKEQREYESLEKEIEALETQKETMTAVLNSGKLSHEDLQAKSEELGKVMDLIDEKTERWMELAEYL